jgi:hypothetical protein
MEGNTIAQALDRYRKILQHGDEKLALIELRVITYMIQQSLQLTTLQLQKTLSNDAVAIPFVEQLVASVSVILQRTGLHKEPQYHDDPDEIINYYNTLWNQNNLSAKIIVGGLVDSLRSTIATLYAGIDLIRESITKDAEKSYSSLIDEVHALKDVRELTVEYLHPQ